MLKGWPFWNRVYNFRKHLCSLKHLQFKRFQLTQLIKVVEAKRFRTKKIKTNETEKFTTVN